MNTAMTTPYQVVDEEEEEEEDVEAYNITMKNEFQHIRHIRLSSKSPATTFSSIIKYINT